ncbi:endo alpha-1,4 polygalactosaminidase [Sanguibacter antarcticus]|nr:endo alpha-1,4 polygalactosaminidase [Sanguibacter antarcticus]
MKHSTTPRRVLHALCLGSLVLALTACEDVRAIPWPAAGTGTATDSATADATPEPSPVQSADLEATTDEGTAEPVEVAVPDDVVPAPVPAALPEDVVPDEAAPAEPVVVEPVATAEVVVSAAYPDDAVGDYQLGGSYTPPAGVNLVVRDSTSKPAPGLYNICYINGFQTQSDDSDAWLKDHPELVLHVDGEPVADPGWPDEYLLDVSTAAKRTAIADIMAVTMTSCADKGFDAIEFDNLDSYLRSDDALDIDDAVATARLYTERGHALGLEVGQKNTAELGSRGRDEVGFDFAIAEECGVYEECSDFTDVYGSHVFAIEYPEDGDFAESCASPGRPDNMILRDLDLVTPSDSDYVYERC